MTQVLSVALSVAAVFLLVRLLSTPLRWFWKLCINTLCGAVLLGPGYAVGMAFAAAHIRNLLGLGSLLAFPGSMIGALLCGVAYKLCPKLPAAYAGEVFGTGILGGLASYPIAAVLMGNTKAALFTFVPSFLISTAVGAAISVLVLSALKRTHVFSSLEGALR